QLALSSPWDRFVTCPSFRTSYKLVPRRRVETMTKHHEPRKTDLRKTDKPEGERTVPDVPQPLPPAEPEDNEDLLVTQDSGPPEEEVLVEPPPPPSASAVNLGRPGEPAQPGASSQASGEIPSDPWTDLLRESPHDS